MGKGNIYFSFHLKKMTWVTFFISYLFQVQSILLAIILYNTIYFIIYTFIFRSLLILTILFPLLALICIGNIIDRKRRRRNKSDCLMMNVEKNRRSLKKFYCYLTFVRKFVKLSYRFFIPYFKINSNIRNHEFRKCKLKLFERRIVELLYIFHVTRSLMQIYAILRISSLLRK